MENVNKENQHPDELNNDSTKPNASLDNASEITPEDIIPVENIEPISLENDDYANAPSAIADEDAFLDDNELSTTEEDIIVEEAAHSTPHAIVEEITEEIVDMAEHGEPANIPSHINDLHNSIEHARKAKEEALAMLNAGTEVEHSEELEAQVLAEVNATEEEYEQAEEIGSEEELPDVSLFNKEELLVKLKNMAEKSLNARNDAYIRKIKEAFEERTNAEREVALNQFIEEGGEEDGFRLKKDETTQQFELLFKGYLGAFRDYRQSQEKQREKALEIKHTILKKIKEMLDGASPSTNLNQLRELQDEWRKAGHVPQGAAQEINQTYRALVDRFFANREIYKELRDLDRQRNLEAKKVLIEKLKVIINEPNLNISRAIGQWKDIQDEFTHIGPVTTKEEGEELWSQLKAIGDYLFQKRRDFLAEQDAKFKGNLEAKKALLASVEPYEEFETEKLSDWNKVSDELKKLQDQWNEIGPAPEAEQSELRKRFWGIIKKFFRNKAKFLNTLEAERKVNLEKKIALIEEAESLQESTDWKTTTQRMKELQEEWRTVGPVPGKDNKTTFERFKKAVDGFFEAMRGQRNDRDAEDKKNLEAKLAIIARIEAMAEDQTISHSIPVLEPVIEEYNQIGYVPRDDIRDTANKLSKAIDNFFRAGKEVDEFEKTSFKLKMNILSGAKGGGNRDNNGGNYNRDNNRGGGNYNRDNRGNNNRANDPASALKNEEYGIKKKIEEMENQIHLWNNNLEFFKMSRNADALRADVQKKIEGLEAEMKKHREKMKAVQAEIKAMKDAQTENNA
jgi:hypothetical protein